MFSIESNPAGIYLLKVNNRNTRTRCEICSKLVIKIPERRHREIFQKLIIGVGGTGTIIRYSRVMGKIKCLISVSFLAVKSLYTSKKQKNDCFIYIAIAQHC